MLGSCQILGSMALPCVQRDVLLVIFALVEGCQSVFGVSSSILLEFKE